MVKIGVNTRFDGVDGDMGSEMIAFDEDGSSRNTTSRQVRRRLERQGEKALIHMLKDEARKMKRAAGGAAICNRADARRVFGDLLARGEKPLKNQDVEAHKREQAERAAAFKHPWQR